MGLILASFFTQDARGVPLTDRILSGSQQSFNFSFKSFISSQFGKDTCLASKGFLFGFISVGFQQGFISFEHGEPDDLHS